MSMQARPTVYRGVQMRSRLEATVASWFDARGWTWKYEPACFADGADQYLPDFLLSDAQLRTGISPSQPTDVYVEVRPTIDKVTAGALREVSVMQANTDCPLVYVGMEDFTDEGVPAAILGIVPDVTEWRLWYAALASNPSGPPHLLIREAYQAYRFGGTDALRMAAERRDQP